MYSMALHQAVRSESSIFSSARFWLNLRLSGYDLACWLLNMAVTKRAAEVLLVGRRVKGKTEPHNVFVHPTMELMQDGFVQGFNSWTPCFLNVIATISF